MRYTNPRTHSLTRSDRSLASSAAVTARRCFTATVLRDASLGADATRRHHYCGRLCDFDNAERQ